MAAPADDLALPQWRQDTGVLKIVTDPTRFILRRLIDMDPTILSMKAPPSRLAQPPPRRGAKQHLHSVHCSAILFQDTLQKLRRIGRQLLQRLSEQSQGTRSGRDLDLIPLSTGKILGHLVRLGIVLDTVLSRLIRPGFRQLPPVEVTAHVVLVAAERGKGNARGVTWSGPIGPALS